VPPPSPTVAMDLSRVVWSVDWTLNGISLHDVYSERIPQPFATPHPKATAAGERARKFTTQGPGTREARVVLHWPSELFANTALAVHPSDRLSVLVKASYLPAGEVGEKAAPSTGMTGMAGMMGYGRKVKEVISGRLTPRIGFFGVKSEAAGAPLAGAALAQGKRFFTRAVVVQVPERVNVGALNTRATDTGVCYTHADFRSYTVGLREVPSLAEQMRAAGGTRAVQMMHDEMLEDGEDDDKDSYFVDALTVVLPQTELLIEFKKLISGSSGGSGYGGSDRGGRDQSPSATTHNRIAFEMVRNLDTGEMIHVSEVGERVQKGIGPEAMHWLLHEEERAGRILIPFISSTVDILKCAPPLPLVSMLGTPESGASLRPVITLDRYSHGVTDRHLAALAFSTVTWRRFRHRGSEEIPALLVTETCGRKGAGARALICSDIDTSLAVSCTLIATNAGMIGATVACYSHPIAVSPQLRDAVAASLVLETAAFEVLLDEAYTLGARAGAASVAAAAKTERKMTAAASLLSHRRGGSADEEEDDDDDENGYSSERSSERGGSVRSKRQSASVDTKKAINAAIAPKAGVPAALGGRGAALAAGRGVPGALAGKAGIPARGAPGKGTGVLGKGSMVPQEHHKTCSLQVTKGGVCLIQSRFTQRAGHFDRTKKGGLQEVVFSLDDSDPSNTRFTLQLSGKCFGLLAPSPYHRNVIQLVIERRSQRAAAAAAAAAASGTMKARADAAGCMPLLYEQPALECGGEPLGIDVPLMGDILELGAARVDYADGCAVQWWRVYPNGARLPIRGAVASRYRLSADDCYCRLEVVCTPYRTQGAGADDDSYFTKQRDSFGTVHGVPLVAGTHTAVAPSDEAEEAVKSAHSWEYAKLQVLCVPLDDGVPSLSAQARSLPSSVSSALAANGFGVDADEVMFSKNGNVGTAGNGGKGEARGRGGGGDQLELYTCYVSKKEIAIREPGMLVLSNLLAWPIRSGICVRIPVWDKPVVELIEDELDSRGGRLYLVFDSLEERDNLVLVFHYLVYHGLQVLYQAQAATRETSHAGARQQRRS